MDSFTMNTLARQLATIANQACEEQAEGGLVLMIALLQYNRACQIPDDKSQEMFAGFVNDLNTPPPVRLVN